jgi:hypothetical protein
LLIQCAGLGSREARPCFDQVPTARLLPHLQHDRAISPLYLTVSLAATLLRSKISSSEVLLFKPSQFYDLRSVGPFSKTTFALEEAYRPIH